MPLPDPYLIFTRKLNALGIRYMIGGSIAAIYYGEPRLTNDVDIIVFMRRADAARFATSFPLEEFYCPPEEVIRMELAREQRGHFNLIHHETGFKADFYLAGRDPLQQWGIERALEVDLEGDRVVMAPPEYVIVLKLQYYSEGRSEKHLRDIARMTQGLGENWDRDALVRLLNEYGLREEWERALASD